MGLFHFFFTIKNTKKEIEGRVLGALSYNTYTKRLLHPLIVLPMPRYPHPQTLPTELMQPRLASMCAEPIQVLALGGTMKDFLVMLNIRFSFILPTSVTMPTFCICFSCSRAHVYS